MKRIISLLLSTFIVFSSLSGYFNVNTSAIEDDSNAPETGIKKISASPINVELASKTGYVDIRDGRFFIAGVNKQSGDVIANTKGITSKSITDFTMKYVYKTYSTKWCRDMVLIHTDSENPNAINSYVFSIQGYRENNGDTKPSLVIVKNDTKFVSSVNTDKGSIVRNFDINVNTDYNIEIKVTGNTISGWVYKVGDTKLSKPSISYTDKSNSYTKGDIAFGCRTTGFFASDITIHDDIKNQDICSDFSPEIYNYNPYVWFSDLSQIKTCGAVNATSDGYRIFTKSQYDQNIYPIQTCAIEPDEKFKYEDFDLSFDYIPNISTGNAKIMFNSNGEENNGYSLVLPGSDENTNIILNQGDSQIGSSNLKLDTKTKYKCEIIKKDNSIKIWIYSGENKPDKELISFNNEILLGCGNIYFYTKDGDFTINNINLKADKYVYKKPDTNGCISYNNGSLSFEQKSKVGYLDIRDGKLLLSGVTPKGDDWVETMGITHKKLTDFTVKYKYTPSSDKWITDVIVLRGDDSKYYLRESGYSFGIQGKSFTIDGVQKDKYSVFIQKDFSKAIQTTNYDTNKAVLVQDVDLAPATEYNVEVYVKGNIISAWIYKPSSQRPSNPTITFTDTENSHKEGDIGFASRCSGCSISDVSVTDDSTENKTTLTSKFNLYNKKQYDITKISSDFKTGSVSLNENKTKISSNSVFYDSEFETQTCSLDYKDGKYIKNFDLYFLYSTDKSCTGKVMFNTRSINSNYSLVVNQEDSFLDIGLCKNGELFADKKLDIKTGVDLQFILSTKDNNIEVYVYKAGKEKPTTPTLSSGIAGELKSGLIYFEVDKGEYCLQDVSLRVNDDPNMCEPIYELNFEDQTLGDGKVDIGTGELVTEEGNTFLRLTRDNVRDGTVRFIFGPSDVKDFTYNMNIRTSYLNSPSWNFVSLKYHVYGDKYYEAQVFPNGCDIALINKGLNYTNLNKKLGMSGKADIKSGNPNHSSDYGLTPDDEWHKLSIVCDGYKYSLYIDGKLKVRCTDKEQMYQKGGFILGGWGASYDIDNIRIYTEKYIDLKDDIIRNGPSGVIFSKNFEDQDYNMNGITLYKGDKEKTKLMKEENGNSFLRCYGDKPNSINANTVLIFGPKNVRDFELNAKIRIKAMFNQSFSWVSVGIHALPTNPRYDTIWMDIGPRGSAVAILNTKYKYSVKHLVASTGKNTTNSKTAFMPTDNRLRGIRPDGKWHDVKTVVKGYTYTLYVDNVKYISYTDSKKFFEKGLTTLCSYGANFDVDDIILTNYR